MRMQMLQFWELRMRMQMRMSNLCTKNQIIKYISYIYIYIIHVNLHINSGMIKINYYPQFETK